MQSKGAPVTGLYGPAANYLSKTVGGVDSTNYQKAAKYLGNAAVQMGNANFPNHTQSGVDMNMTELNPNLSMNDATITDLLNTNIRSTKYTLDSIDRAKKYVDAGNEPLNFPTWNNQKFRRDVIVNADQSATGPNGQKIYKLGGRWLDAGGQPVKAQQ